MVRVRVLNDALTSMYNTEKRGKRQVMIRPSSKVIIKFLLVMQKRGYIGEFDPCFDVGVKDIEPWTARLLPSRQFGYIVLTTSVGIMDHEEARGKNVGVRYILFTFTVLPSVVIRTVPLCLDSEDLQIYPGSQFLEGEDTTKWPQVPPLGLVVQHKNGWHYRIKQEPPSILPAHLVINETRLNWLIRNVKIHYGGEWNEWPEDAYYWKPSDYSEGYVLEFPDANSELLCLGIVKGNIKDKAFPGGEWIVGFDDDNPPIYLVYGLKFEMLKDEDLMNAFDEADIDENGWLNIFVDLALTPVVDLEKKKECS
ncbi:40S ribosomal protein S15a [Thalictrum thalictroides]|uniref:40S ribosomal protein S15a n=1 Tax=Thalictrum thalictroides TaxID=46969 RepID=A0A7J6V2M8_THATH|nr:40S ribosomal protein S15a [Thalictrum thalictroides]